MENLEEVLSRVEKDAPRRRRMMMAERGYDETRRKGLDVWCQIDRNVLCVGI